MLYYGENLSEPILYVHSDWTRVNGEMSDCGKNHHHVRSKRSVVAYYQRQKKKLKLPTAKISKCQIKI